MQNKLSNTNPKTLMNGHHSLLIGLDLASSPDESVFMRVNHHFSAKQVQPNATEQLAICSMVCAINTLAMLNSEVLHINVAYAPHCADLEVKVFPVNTDYFGKCKALFSRCVHLDAKSTLDQLKAVEDDLIELIGTAKDRLMGAV